MKATTKHITYFLLLTIYLFSCAETSSTNEDPSVKLSESEIEIELAVLIEKYKQAEQEIVRENYQKLDEEIKSNQSYEAYHSDLTTRYRSYIATSEERFEAQSNGRIPKVEITTLREESRISESIPDWYWNFKQEWKEKVRNSVLQ